MAEITRLHLDSGSHRTYITQSLANRLNLKGESEQVIKLVTFGCDNPKILKTKQTSLCFKLRNGNILDIVANIVLVISNDYYLDIILSQKIKVQPGLYLLGSNWVGLLLGVQQKQAIAQMKQVCIH